MTCATHAQVKIMEANNTKYQTPNTKHQIKCHGRTRYGVVDIEEDNKIKEKMAMIILANIFPFFDVVDQNDKDEHP